MNINNMIKSCMHDLKGTKDKEHVKQTLETYKMIKTSFMEYVTNEKNAKKLIDNHVFNIEDDVSVRVEKLPEQIQMSILEDMVKEHKKNLDLYKDRQDLLDKEKAELDILNNLLPQEATKEDIEKILNERYPYGISKQQMGLVIKEVKGSFNRVDGRLVADCVKNILS